jgi:redox-sensitive bicupin YhaK (pirin superfamily)
MGIERRSFLRRLGIGLGTALTIPFENAANTIKKRIENSSAILDIEPMGFQWETLDPFLFCVHHEDHIPKGNVAMGPATSLSGRSLGDDFIIKDGFRMYHGRQVPGFPGHPHRGFETITVVRKGLVDHADSLGAAGRYGNGDVQWMTAGKGVQHSEMFPLLKQDKENPLELFQIWINLPAAKKMVEPHFKMLWSESIPKIKEKDKNGKQITIEVIAGSIGKNKALQPPPNSWAANPTHEVAVWNIFLEEGAEWNIPATSKGINRKIYFYEGDDLNLEGQIIKKYHSVSLQSDKSIRLKAGKGLNRILLLQGKPIGERVIQYGPFVMNTKEEINQAFEDYHRTQFGGWPWSRMDQVHPRNKGRFAKHADGTLEEKA